MKLTAAMVDRIKPIDKRQEIPDGLCVGLYLVVQPTGKKGWQVRYRHSGTHRRMTLGTFPVLSLADARARARDVIAATYEGRDPAAEVRLAKAPKSPDDRNEVRSLVDLFERRHLSHLRSGAEVRRAFDRYVLPLWGERDVGSITRRDVIDLLDGLVDTGKGTTANRVRAYLSRFFGWCAERDVIGAHPMIGIKAPVKEQRRDRFLTDDEIRWLWQACDEIGYPFGPYVKLLLLTGQRSGEVGKMMWREIDGTVWKLSSERTKNGHPHEVPLSPLAGSILDGVERFEGAAGYVFTTTGETPVSGISRALGRITGKMQVIAAKERGESLEIPHWTFHDLRRTAATGMARIGIAVRVTEAVLNHVSGTGGGIVAVYQRHDYADEKRKALDAWARFVGQVVSG
ncbi:tyrosine-type recombinase/integrase [Paenirhodobacter enshiensis]|uniref:tyrosine-type recombinase/integrase n=1 Tax=Paenirhodobacter enshiensis TaxID=1105367 RepID=UPI0035B26866